MRYTVGLFRIIGLSTATLYFRIPITAIASMWRSDIIWRHRSGSTLAQVMDCYLKVPIKPLPMLTFHQRCSLCGIHMKAQAVLMILICNMCSDITLLKLLPHFPVAIELMTNKLHCVTLVISSLIKTGDAFSINISDKYQIFMRVYWLSIFLFHHGVSVEIYRLSHKYFQ